MIVVTFAVRQEGAIFERRLSKRTRDGNRVTGRLGSRDVTIYWLGIGVEDRLGFRRMIEEMRPRCVIDSGFAGAIRTLLEPGDFVLANNSAAETLTIREGLCAAKGRIVQVPAVLDPPGKARIRRENAEALAVDMESDVAAAICKEFQIPFLTARMISDRYDEGIPGIFLGRGMRSFRDFADAVRFASRMLSLRVKLAEKLEELIDGFGGHAPTFIDRNPFEESQTNTG
jgi:nucleoside phosphorylase